MPFAVLVIDDDPKIIRGIKRFLEQFEFEVDGIGTVSGANSILEKKPPDLVILDLSLPDGHGYDVAKKIQDELGIAIIVVSGSGEHIDKILALELGADDYISKPFEMRELLARCRSVLRRTILKPQDSISRLQNESSMEAKVNGWTFNFTKCTAKNADGVSPKLTTTEFKILEFLMRANGVALSRDVLMANMKGKSWGPMDRSIDVMIGKIRKKITDIDSGFDYILTVRGEGYKFTEKVSWS